MYAAVHGFILAFGLILPLGVQNVFVFNQGVLQKRFRNTLPVVITASVCDTLLILLAVTGVSLIVLGTPWIKSLLMVGGTLFLFYMGWITWRNASEKDEANNVKPLSSRKQILFALSVSLLNPHAIIDTVGVIGTSSLNYSGINKLVFVSATIIVSWIWFFGLAVAGKITRKLDNEGKFVIILNKVSAFIIWGVAIYLGYSFIK